MHSLDDAALQNIGGSLCDYVYNHLYSDKYDIAALLTVNKSRISYDE